MIGGIALLKQKRDQYAMSLHFITSISSLVGISFALAACGGTSASDGQGGTSGTTAGTTGNTGGRTGNTGGTTGNTGGTTGNTGGTTSSSGGSGGTCPPLPACIADLVTNCAPAGTCVESSTMPTDPTMPITDAQCYSNGVKTVTSITFDLASSTISFSSTVSKNGSACYSFSSSDGATLTVKNASGTPVATITNDASGNSVVACGGQTYTQPADCSSAMMPGDPTAAGGGASCTMGACSP